MGDIRNVLVVGGGIGGLSTTIALGRSDVQVDVVEKNPAWDVYGVGIIQPPNALRALHAIGLAERCLEVGHPIMGGRNHLADGTVIGEDDYPPAVQGWPPMNGLTRPALHEILTSTTLASGADVRVGVTVTEILQRHDGVDVTFTDGSSGSYDLLIGADGLYSPTREMLFGNAVKPRYTGQVCFRYNLPRLEGLDRIHVYIGGEAGTAGFVPLSDELMYMLFILKWPDAELRQDPRELHEVMRAKLQPFGGEVARQRERITDPGQVVYRPVDNIVMPAPWYQGRALLIGDAAHGTSPHAGQGAAQAIEDGVVLAEEIASGKAADEVLETFMARRYERCKQVVELSAAIGAWEQRPDPDVNPGDIRNRIMAVCAVPV
jgi:2-polyprenyl-6-methoxyphenol hydroxylase-like FAD-dependent oxidoreductase